MIVEEPLTLRIDGTALTLMRTPGHEQELAAGFCLSEGVIAELSDVLTFSYCPSGRASERNVLDVRLRDEIILERGKLIRATTMRDTGGASGGKMIDSLLATVKAGAESRPARVKRNALLKMPGVMRERQPLFAATGAAHAVAAFTREGKLLVCREDIGRHNALDKTLGHLILNKISITDKVLLLSGRVSFEMAAKCFRAGCKIMAAVSAPTSLAVELARRAGITLVGFLRGEKMNIYTHPERILPD